MLCSDVSCLLLIILRYTSWFGRHCVAARAANHAQILDARVRLDAQCDLVIVDIWRTTIDYLRHVLSRGNVGDDCV